MSRDHIDSMPITTVLSTLGVVDAAHPSDDLINVANVVPKRTRFTSFWDQNGNANVDGNHELTSIDRRRTR